MLGASLTLGAGSEMAVLKRLYLALNAGEKACASVRDECATPEGAPPPPMRNMRMNLALLFDASGVDRDVFATAGDLTTLSQSFKQCRCM